MDTFNWVTMVVGVLTLIGNIGIAYWWGPIRAAKVARDLQREAALADRRFDIFRRLTATRRLGLHPDHVWALNLIPVDFNDSETVLEDWRKYIEHLGFNEPQDEAMKEAFYHDRNKRLLALIRTIGVSVGVNLDKLDAERYAYLPVAWHEDEIDQRIVRKLSKDVLSGLRPISVQVKVPGTSPFPPAPMDEP